MRKYIFISGFVLLFMAVFYIGHLFSDTSKEKANHNINVNVTEQTSILKEEKNIQLGTKSLNRASLSKRPDQYVKSLASDLISFSKHNYSSNQYYKSIADFWPKFDLLNEDQLYEVFDILKNDDQLSITSMRILYTRMVEVNPTRAMELVNSRNDQFGIDHVLRAWSLGRPLEAMQWVKDNKHIIDGSSYRPYKDLFVNIAKVDPVKAFEFLDEIDPVIHKDAIRGIASALENKDDFLWLVKLDTFKDKPTQMTTVMAYWTKKSPLDAIQYAQNIDSSKERNRLTYEVKKAWLASKPEEAAAWIVEQQGRNKETVMEVLNGWNRTKGDKLYNWLKSNTTDESKDFAVSHFISYYGFNNTDLAIKALDGINSKKVREKSVVKIYRLLKSRSNKLASEFLNNRKEFTESEKDKLRSKKNAVIDYSPSIKICTFII